MTAGEVVDRAKDELRQAAWRPRQVHVGDPWRPPVTTARRRSAALSACRAQDISEPARSALVDAANDLLDGTWEVLGTRRYDLTHPDWFLDPVSGIRAPQTTYCFNIDHRSSHDVGDVKQVWELSRHHHLTVLAGAWFVTEDDRYAEAVQQQLTDWWRQNPFLSGIHWTSGIELGIRLISWAWIRRLLARWPGVTTLFDESDLAACQIRWHQRYLASFVSSGTSSNNHVVAEAAGQLVASCAFPWFPESRRWRRSSAALLRDQLDANTFPSGLNREQASEYHCFVTELALVAAVEAEAAGCSFDTETWDRTRAMVDAAAAVVDETLQGPRQGDGDDGRALLIDAPHASHWPSLLSAGASVFGALPWWPATGDTASDVRSVVLGSLVHRARRPNGRPTSRPTLFGDAGLVLLRTSPGRQPEIWCRGDVGPHGHLRIAAHAHADALAVEVRHGGVDVLVDPGTFCYHTAPEWRTYFRSTLAHNTLELAGEDQSVSGGPFLWVRHALTRLLDVGANDAGEAFRWSAEHDGYARLGTPAVHRRTVALDQDRRRLTIVDEVEADEPPSARLAFHLGPTVRASLGGCTAHLSWRQPVADGTTSTTTARLALPDRLSWSLHRGEADPILGWFSPTFGTKQPTTTLVGQAPAGVATGLIETTLQFDS